jgi:hypothetical protein
LEEVESIELNKATVRRPFDEVWNTNPVSKLAAAVN